MEQNNKGITRGELEGRVIELLKAHSEKDSSPIAIAINGNWGVGKSYMYRESLAGKIEKEFKREPIYTSVFGKKDENAIIQDLVAQFLKKKNALVKALKPITGYVGQIILRFFGLPNANMGSVLNFLEKKDLKNTIICIDDFERLSDKIPMQDILGLISELKENKGCHIILLCSEDHIDAEQRSAFYHYKEKIIDFDFFYNPTPMEQLRIFEGSQEYEKYVAQIADNPSIKTTMDRFQITNLREIRRLIFYFNSYCEQLEEGIDDIKKCQEDEKERFFGVAFVIVVEARAIYHFKKDDKLAEKYSKQNKGVRILQDTEEWLKSNALLSEDEKHDARLRSIKKFINDDVIKMGDWLDYSQYEKRQQWLFDLFDNNIAREISDFSVEKAFLEKIQQVIKSQISP